MTVLLVVTAGAAAFTFVVVRIRAPDFGVVMVVLEAEAVVEFDCLVVAVEFDSLVVELEAVEEFDDLAVVVVAIEFDNLVVEVEVEFVLTVVALAALVVAVEFDGAIVVAFDLIVVAEVTVELLVVAVVLPDLELIGNYFFKTQPFMPYLVVIVGAVAVVGDMVVLIGFVIVPLFVSWIQFVRLKILIYTPGTLAWPHPIPQATIPARYQ